MKKKIFLFAMAIFVFLAASCKNSTGLGEAIDLTGPQVTITYPTMRGAVSDKFYIEGIAYDNKIVKKLTVTVDGKEWKNENGVWTFKAENGYVPYDDAVWEKNSQGQINWRINNVEITSGTKTLVVSAIDDDGNTGANSQKIITILYDNEPPKVTLINPNIKHKSFEGIKNAFATDDYKQLQIVNNVLTGAFTVSGVCVDDNTVCNVKVFVKKVSADGTISDFIEKNLVLKDESDQNEQNPAPANTESAASLRSWKVEITDSDLQSIGEDKQFLQIFTEASDSAKNGGQVKDHGYVLLWKKANNPWITIDLGESATPKIVYSGVSCQGTAFDNEQIAQILLTITMDGQNDPVEGFNSKNIFEKNTSEDSAQTANFNFLCPTEIGKYKVRLVAKDNLENSSEVFEGYIEVQDNTFPSIEIEPITNPFGDANGNIVLKICAYDNSQVKSIKYKICETAQDKAVFSDKNSANWNTDQSVVKIENPTATGETSEGGFTQKKYELSETKNLFSDLGIGMNAKKLAQTTFIFLVEDEQQNKSLTKFVLPADTTPPQLEFEKIGTHSLASLEEPIEPFTQDFEISGTWSEDSFFAWKNLNDAKKAPKLTVKILDEEVESTLTEGKWSAAIPLAKTKKSGETVSPIDFEISMTDIGGSTAIIQKSIKVNTEIPEINYISCNLPNGAYPAGNDIEITLNFNRPVTVTGVPSLTLNNGQTATYTSGNGTKTLVFAFKTENAKDTPSGKILEITGASFNGGSIKATNLAYEESNFESFVTSVQNKSMGKEIKILTSKPAYQSHTWNDATGKLTIIFSGLVKAKGGTITITQKESTLLAPAFFTKEEYNSMPAAVKAYYEEGTLGADKNFASDLSTKYVLKYDTNTNDAALLAAYKASGAHKTSVNILGEKVKATPNPSSNTTTFELDFGLLVCKGAEYTFDIPQGLVENDAGTTNAAASQNQIFSSGIESPVVRIKKPTQTIAGASATAAGSVNHALSTTFKIDCKTPGAALSYAYDCLVAEKCQVAADGGVSWGGTSGNIDERQEEWQVQFTYKGQTYFTNKSKSPFYTNLNITPAKNAAYSKTSQTYTQNADVAIGKNGNADINYDAGGLTYQITATASKGGENAAAYEVAYRTTLLLKDFSNGTNGIADNLKNAHQSYWVPAANGANVAIFIRGSDNLEGANSTSGLPCSWNINEKDKCAMLKKEGNDYYFTTWSITTNKFYFQPVGGLCDESTNTQSGNAGPAKSIFLQDAIIFALDKYPIGKGQFTEISYAGSRFDLGVPGKVMNHR